MRIRLGSFWSNVNKDGPVPEHMPELGPCWVWTAGRFACGYGQFAKGRPSRYAHRISWALANGPVPDGLWVLHKCDNRPCVRPDHLFLGTHADNMRDMVEKGRSTVGDRNGSRLHPERLRRGDNHPSRTRPERRPKGDGHWTRKRPDGVLRGEAHGAAKLTERDVVEIRRLVASGGVRKAVGSQFGITGTMVSAIVNRTSWAHVKDTMEATDSAVQD